MATYGNVVYGHMQEACQAWILHGKQEVCQAWILHTGARHAMCYSKNCARRLAWFVATQRACQAAFRQEICQLSVNSWHESCLVNGFGGDYGMKIAAIIGPCYALFPTIAVKYT